MWLYSLQRNKRLSPVLCLRSRKLCHKAQSRLSFPTLLKDWMPLHSGGKELQYSEEVSLQTPSCSRTSSALFCFFAGSVRRPSRQLSFLQLPSRVGKKSPSFLCCLSTETALRLQIYLPWLKKWLILRCEETYTGPLLQS